MESFRLQDTERQYHPQLVGLLPSPVALVPLVEGIQIELIDHVGNEVRQVTLREPVEGRRREQQRLLRRVRPERCRHEESYHFIALLNHTSLALLFRVTGQVSTAQTPRAA